MLKLSQYKIHAIYMYVSTDHSSIKYLNEMNIFISIEDITTQQTTMGGKLS